MKNILATVLTCLFVAVVLGLAWQEYQKLQEKPWTRDGQVQADIILIAPRISGPVTKVHTANNQWVNKGDLLFELDDDVWQAAVQSKKAALAQADARAREAADQARIANNLHAENPGAISLQRWQQADNALKAAQAAQQMAQADLHLAELHLRYTKVRAPVDGYVTNSNLRPGAQAVADTPLFALIDAATFRITGFFLETVLRHIAPGSPASITLMSYPDTVLTGQVESIDWGITQSNDENGPKLLPRVSPTFDWIRLAQRIPVNIRLHAVPPDMRLRVGTTASVQISPLSQGLSPAALPATVDKAKP